MSKINTINWKSFFIEELFDAYLSNDDIQPKNITDGDIPLISSGKEKNGIVAYIKDDTAKLWSKNTITVDMFGKAFYQDEAFYCVSHGRVNVLVPKIKISKYALQYIATIIEKVASNKYEFKEMCTGSKLLKDIIKLPVNESNEPHFSYMEEYMKNKEITVRSSLTKLQLAKKASFSPKICTSEWKEFVLSEIFEMQKQSEISPIQAYYDDNDGVKYPFYGQSKVNNGIISYISLDDKYLNNKDALCAILIHSNTHECVLATTPFYLKDGHGATSIFSNNKLTELSALFIMSVLKNVMSEKFNYDKKATKEALRELKLPLPADETGSPDYDYMVAFMKNQNFKAINTLKHLKFV